MEIQKINPLHERIFHSFKEPLRLIAKDKRGLVGVSITLMFVLMATIGPLIFPYDRSINPSLWLAPPSWAHPLGCDDMGRDLFRMLIAGSRSVLLISAMAAFFITTVGISIGMISGLVGGKIDSALMFISDVALTLPGTVLIAVLAVYIRKVNDPVTLALILSLTAWAGLSRGIRAQVLSLKERAFIEVAKTIGLSKTHIILRELLPNLMNYVTISFFWSVIRAIMATVGLFFLGLVPFEETNWGVMLNNAISKGGTLTPLARFQLLVPIVTITLLQTGFIFLAAGMESLFNPRLRED